MIPLLPEPIESYLNGLLPPRDPLLARMEASAKARKIPIVGPLVAMAMAQLVRTIGAHTVFEMGSAIGYSTIWLARAVGPGGRVYYTDTSQEHADEALGYFQEAGVADRVTVLTGNAIFLIKEAPGPFDVVFNDIDKDGYPAAFEAALPKLRPGGLLLTDNVLWSGKVAEHDGDDWTEAIKTYNRLLYGTPGLSTFIIPLRDGLAVTLKQAP